jgi:hypothetical protein
MRFSEKLRHVLAVRFALLLVCAVVGGIPVRAKEPELGPITKIFVAKIQTMDSNNRVAQAVGIDWRGLIVKVGTEDEIFAAAPGIDRKGGNVIRLDGKTLLPGFFDAHLHLDALLTKYSGLAEMVGPCLPQPYASANTKDCRNYIKETFAVVQKKLEDEAKNGAGDPGKPSWSASISIPRASRTPRPPR